MIRRLVLIVSIATVVVATVAAGGVYWFFRGDGARLALERQATRWLGQPVAIGSATVHIFPRPAISLRDVRAGDPVRIVLANVQLSTRLKPLLSRRIEDADVIVSNSRIDMPLPFAMPVTAPGSTTTATPEEAGVRVVSVRAITLRNVTIASRGRQITVSADSSLSSAHLNLDRFTATSGETSLEVSGLVQLTPRLDAQLRVMANHIDLDDLIALADAFSPRAARRTSTGPAPGLPGRIMARVSAETARASGIDVRQFATTLVAQGNRITLSPASFQLFGGRYQGMIDIDSESTSLKATVRAQIAGLDVAQLAAFGGAPDTISGRLSGAGTFNGRGVTIGDALAAAAGEGTVTITNGALKRLGLVRTVVLFFGRPAPGVTPSTDHFDRIDATFALVQEVLAASAFSLHSPDIDLVGQGTLTIPSKSLDGQMDLSLSEALSAQAGTDLIRFTRDGNRVLLPATLGGTLDAPRVSIDAGAAVRRGLRNEVERRLRNILGGLAPAPPD
jgi:hypothetical protein